MIEPSRQEIAPVRVGKEYENRDGLLAEAIRVGTRYIRQHGLDGLEPEILRPETETRS